jgi:uncharacterized SAM-binding protein YcdF (DUF218 family)
MSALTELRATACMIGASLWHGIAGPLRRLVFVLGGIAAVMVVLAATRLPFDAHRALGTAAGECDAPAELLVVLGGSGMPSAAELRRLYHAAEVAQAMPAAALLVIHPGDPAVLQAMVAELHLRGVGAGRIRSLNEGDNTRAQALAVREYLGSARPSMVLITAPENMYRSVRAFRRAGFPTVCGAPAWDHAMDHAFTYAHRGIGGKAYVPDVSDATGLRYTWWNYLKLQVTCLREYVAIAYYALNGWI